MQKINLDKARKLINELEDKLNATTEHTADARKRPSISGLRVAKPV
jgi:ABC-type Fe3+-hydroxamate transport system substrate-binding protein